jgi:hypothetical protein
MFFGARANSPVLIFFPVVRVVPISKRRGQRRYARFVTKSVDGVEEMGEAVVQYSHNERMTSND